MAYPDTTLTSADLVLHLVADDITGLSDGASVTTQWEERIGSNASAVENGDPKYVEDALNGRAGVRFTRSANDILRWPLAYFDDCFVIIVGLFNDEGAVWQVALDLALSTNTASQNLFAFRYNSNLMHTFSRGSVENANNSNPQHGVLQVFGFWYRAGSVRHYSDPDGGGYVQTDSDATIQGQLDNFDRAYVGGDPSTSANAMDGDILDVLVYHQNADGVQAERTALMQALDDWYSTVPLDTASEVYKIEARHGEST